MSWPAFHFDAGLDLFPMLAGLFAAVSCGLLGNFLVLRRLSLMGDAISHSVLPGLVIAFMVASSRDPLVMFVGAAAAGVMTVVLVEIVKKLGRVEPGAAMGVVFSVLFALGVLLIEQDSARNVDLDADCVLYGQLETLLWYTPPVSWDQVFQLRTWIGYEIEPAILDPVTGDVIRAAIVHEGVPRQVTTLAALTLGASFFVVVLFKELRLAAFDPALATTLGFNAGVLHYVLMVFVAAATVASFEAVGSILVIAMLICPAATARLMTDRLRTQIVWSVVFAVAASMGGYVLATAVPSVWGAEPVNAAGAMTVVSGVLLVGAIIASPRHGVVMRAVRRRRLATRVAIDDLLGTLYRLGERGERAADRGRLAQLISGVHTERAIAAAERQGLLAVSAGAVSLTEAGRSAGGDIIRRHRLWETYLVDEAGVSPDHVHDTAERLEHLPPAPEIASETDPHGRAIPPGS